MAQKEEWHHTLGERPPALADPAASSQRRTVAQLVRAVAVLPLHKLITLDEAFAQVKKLLGGSDLTALTLTEDALRRRLTVVGWQTRHDGSKQASIFRSVAWRYLQIFPPTSLHPAQLARRDGVRASVAGGGWNLFVVRRRFDRLYSDPAATTPVLTVNSESEAPINAKRGRKPYDFWELYKVKFYLMLDNDDVPAHADINVSDYANRLMDWGSNNDLGRVPGPTRMREKVAEWKPLWERLKSANK